MAYGSDRKNLTYLGIAGMIDPPRDGVFDAIQTLLHSGVDVKMITGDARETAVAIASSVGLTSTPLHTLSGEQLESMDHYELNKWIEKVKCEMIYVMTNPYFSPLVAKVFHKLLFKLLLSAL